MTLESVSTCDILVDCDKVLSEESLVSVVLLTMTDPVPVPVLVFGLESLPEMTLITFSKKSASQCERLVAEEGTSLALLSF